MKRGRPVGSKNKESVPENGSLPILRRVYKQLQELSNGSGIKIHQVWLDVLENGLVATREMYRPLTDGHKTLIEYRKSLREQLDETDTNDDTAGLDGTRQADLERNGHTDLGLVGSTGLSPELQPVADGLDLAPVGPGLSTEGDEATGSDRGDDQ